MTIKAATFVKDGDSYIEISIIDTGVGIKNQDKNKLFKWFGFV